LDVSRALRALNSAEVCSQTRSGCIQNRRVREVQELRPKLNASFFVDGKFFVDPQIECCKSWPTNSTDAARAKCTGSSGAKGRSAPVNPLNPSGWMVLPSKFLRRTNAVCPGSARVGAGSISTRDSNRDPAVDAHDGTDLPVPQDPSDDRIPVVA